ncbi:MAG: hypothetical protein MZV70_64720 [Desulfobacterales bacterium]|nr:hypothetical protein [Desulfobacterales bacterium]
MISVSSWTFAQEGGSPGSVKSDKELLTEKTVETTKVLNWETGAGKSYLIPALEIPAFLLLLNGYDRLAYPDDMEPDGKKVYDTNLSTFWDHVVHGPWGIDRGRLRHEPVRTIRIRDPCTMDSRDQRASTTGNRSSTTTWAAFSGKRAGRPHTHPSMTRSPAALAGASSERRSSGWPAWCSRAMAKNPGSCASWVRR